MPERPNIPLVMTDQQRFDTLRCTGHEHMITPHVDALAARGTAFSHAFVQGAVCGPSRSSIVSARFVHTHGVFANEEWLGPGQPNWIEDLRDGGYHTVNIGKMHTCPIRRPVGFDHRTVVENKNYQQGLHGQDPDDYDLFLMQYGQRVMARTHDWKLVLYLGQPFGELHDLRSDPEELHNLYAAAAGRQARGVQLERTLHWYGTTPRRP